MEKTIKMFIETDKGEKLEQAIPDGLIAIYREKGWKEVEDEPEKLIEKPFFSTKKTNKFKTKK